VKRGEWGEILDRRVGLKKGEGTVRMEGRREGTEGRERWKAWKGTG
jgi:hypothetical protein